ncbi:MAG: peptide deformylase [Actinomycetota bacterium]
MAVRPVLRFPHPVLKQPAERVGTIDDTARGLAADLTDTMRASPACVGLAANQIGVGLRAFVIDVTGHRRARSSHGLVVLFDPEIVSTTGDVVAREGCMSVPDLTGDVARASEVVVRGTSLEGHEVTITADAFEARALMHEIDHLDGKLFLDRASSHRSVFQRRTYH